MKKEFIVLTLLFASLPLLLIFAASFASPERLQSGIGFYTDNIYPFLPKVSCGSLFCSEVGYGMNEYHLYQGVQMNLNISIGEAVITDAIGFANLRDKPVNILMQLNNVTSNSNITVIIKDKYNTIELTKDNPYGSITLNPKSGVTIDFIIETQSNEEVSFLILFMEETNK